MAWTCLAILLVLSAAAHGSYNPIPVGAVIVSTVKYIYVMQPNEYGGANVMDTIFSAVGNMSIVNTVFDSDKRNLYVMYTNSTGSGTLFISQLTSVEQLSPTVFQLPLTMNVSSVNQLNSFSSDILNRRVFLTDNLGKVRAYSMAGLMQTDVVLPASIPPPVRSIFYANTLNKLFVITDTKIYTCANFDSGDLQCCPGQANGNQLRAITVDATTSDTYVYVLDERSGVYRVAFDAAGCPTSLNPINTFTTATNLHFAIDRGLCFVSSGGSMVTDNNFLLIANGSQTVRNYPVGGSIVALHVSTPSMVAVVESEQTCFHGISYGDYRVAVILAALFGTLMGILLCFNTLFCIDFLMTKRIIRNLKQQIPHNLLEDRWNKLVEEKYAKIALEKQRKKDDPPPRRLSSIAPKSYTPATGSAVINATTASPGGRDEVARTDSLSVPNPIPRLSAYLRRKSESYVSRRRSDDPRAARAQPTFVQVPEERPRTERSRTERAPPNIPEIHIGPVPEENEAQRGLRSNLSRQELLHDDDFL